jgi:hypothetical protein
VSSGNSGGGGGNGSVVEIGGTESDAESEHG